jgi:ubiquitin carboxyl-terminal hydrolase 10
VHTIQDVLAHISQSRPVQAGQPSSIEAGQQMHFEALPPILVLHLERFLHDAAADGINKINRPIQFPPELEIPLGTTSPFFSMLAQG